MTKYPDKSEISSRAPSAVEKSIPLSNLERQRELFSPKMYDLLTNSTRKDRLFLLPQIKESFAEANFDPSELPQEGVTMHELATNKKIPTSAWMNLVTSDFLWKNSK